jgi:hypothetical protein
MYMGKSLNSDKLITWRRRLAKLDASGLSVTAFCRQEDITPARFYYWSRRLREAEDVVAVGKNAAQANRQSVEIIQSVEVVIGEQVKVRLPSNDHGLISAVLASLQASALAAKAGGSFQRIDVSRASVA